MKPPRSKIWRIGAVIVLALGVVFVSYLLKPLPPPKVALQLVGFKTNRTVVFHQKSWTNRDGRIDFSEGVLEFEPSFQGFPTNPVFALCTIVLTNQGSTRIWWNSRIRCYVEARTPGGWMTNSDYYMTTIDYPVAPSSNDFFVVAVPVDAIEWRVACQYGYWIRHNVRLDVEGWLYDHRGLGRTISKYAPEAIWWALRQLPESGGKMGEVSTPFFTNRPPQMATLETLKF